MSKQLSIDLQDDGKSIVLGRRRVRTWRDLSPEAKQFYTTKLEHVFHATMGTQFEDEIAKVLDAHYPDYENPSAMGSQGDWGCDGYVANGRVLFACYGTQNIKKENDYVRSKVSKDFNRALKKWPQMAMWIFITNVLLGAEFHSRTWIPLRQSHDENSERPVDMRIWDYADIERLLVDLTEEELDLLWPGYAGQEDFELRDLIEVIDCLVDGSESPPSSEDIEEVSPFKMSYNEIDENDKVLLHSGIVEYPRIKALFDKHEDPELRDRVAFRLHANWEALNMPACDSSDVLHSLFRKIGGNGYDTSGKTRRMSTYALAAFFFQTCDIFENVPDGWVPEAEGGLS